MSRTLFISVVCVASILLLFFIYFKDSEFQELTPNVKIQRGSPGGDLHDYRFTAQAGSYQEIRLTQLSADISFEVSDAATGEVLFDWDTPIARVGMEIVCFETPADGTYQVAVSAYNPDEGGSYAIERRHLPMDAHSRARLAAFSLELRATGENADEAVLLQQAQHAWAALSQWENAAMAAWRRALVLKKRYERGEMVACYRTSMEYLARAKQPEMQAMATYFMADAQYKSGQLDLALASYRGALKSYPHEDRDRADILESLGKVELISGFHEQGRIYLEQAFAIHKAVGKNTSDLASLYAGRGKYYLEKGNYQEALAMFQRGVEIADGRFPQISHRLLTYRATALLEMGELGQAMNSLEAASAVPYLPPSQLRDAVHAIHMAEILLKRKHYEQARSLLEKSLPFLEKETATKAQALYDLAQTADGLKQHGQALRFMQQAIKLFHSIQVDGLSRGRKHEWLSVKSEYTDYLLDLQVNAQEGNAPNAFRLAALRSGDHALPMLQQNSAFTNQFAGLRSQLTQLADRINTQVLHLEANPDLQEEARLAALLEGYEKDLGLLQPSSAPKSQSAAVDRFAQLQSEILNQQTSLLFFSMGRDNVYLWVITEQEPKLFRLALRHEIEALARDYHEASAKLGNSAGNKEAVGAQLSKRLFGACWPHLRGKRLLIIPDGALFYVPFAAMPKPTGSGLLLDRFEIVSQPSLAMALRPGLSRKSAAKAEMLIVSNPEFGEDFKPLDGASQEAGSLAAKAMSAGLKTTHLWGVSANRANVLSAPAFTEARYLHFATHGLFLPRHPELSALVLATRDAKGNSLPGYLRAQDIKHLQLSADLVVLSACNTALGSQQRGMGLIGLSSAFLDAGADGVLVSLWRIDDSATSLLIDHFYQGLLTLKLSPAQALRRAQLKMKENGWQDPYYWSGFVYQGHWRKQTK